MRYEPCACGGEIAAVATDADAIFVAVWRHNRRTRHRAWRLWWSA